MAESTEPKTPDEQMVIAWLQDHDEVCPMCAYDLRGHANATCSECGWALRLGVTAKDASLAPYVFLIVACSCALGFDGVSVLIMTWGLITSNGQPPEFFIMFGIMLMLAVDSAIALWITLRSRKRVVRKRRHRWAPVFGMALAIFLVHLVAGAFIISLFI